MLKTAVPKPRGLFSRVGSGGGCALGVWGLRNATSKATINRVAKSTDLLPLNRSICEGIHDKMAVCVLQSDKVSDGSKSSDKKSVVDPNSGRHGAFVPETRLLTANGLL